MAGIIDFPQVVREALRDFGDLFANDPQRRHFAEYLTGLYVAARKTVTGINAEFARTTDQSCLNRFVHLDAWDEQALNQRRLDLMRQLRQCHAYEWAYRKLTTIGEACRAILHETLRSTLR